MFKTLVDYLKILSQTIKFSVLNSPDGRGVCVDEPLGTLQISVRLSVLLSFLRSVPLSVRLTVWRDHMIKYGNLKREQSRSSHEVRTTRGILKWYSPLRRVEETRRSSTVSSTADDLSRNLNFKNP